jgi:hypothetical protein
MREVVQRDDRLHPVIDHRLHHVGVVIERSLVPLRSVGRLRRQRRLASRPLDPESERVQSERRGERDMLGVVGPEPDPLAGFPV